MKVLFSWWEVDLVVNGPGGRGGTLHLAGGWLVVCSSRTVTITGALCRTHVAAQLPAGYCWGGGAVAAPASSVSGSAA